MIVENQLRVLVFGVSLVISFSTAWAQAPCPSPRFNQIPPSFQDVQISQGPNDKLHPDIVVDPFNPPGGQGSVYVVWWELVGPTSSDVMFSSSTTGGQTWSTATKINTLGIENVRPKIAVDQNCTADGRIWVVWHNKPSISSPESRIKASLSFDGGMNWSSTEATVDPTAPFPVQQVEAVITVSGASAWISWQDDRNQIVGPSTFDIFLSCAIAPPIPPLSPNFSLPVLLNDRPGERFLQALDLDVPVPVNNLASPDIHVAWQSLGDSPDNTLFSSSDAYCIDPPPAEIVVPTNGLSVTRQLPSLESFRSIVAIVYADGSWSPSEIAITYQYSTTLGAVWGPEIQLDPTWAAGINQSAPDITMTYPDVNSPWACDAFPFVSPKLYASWEDDRNNPLGPRDLNISCNDGNTTPWSAPATVNDTLGGLGAGTSQAIAGDVLRNDVYAVWRDNQNPPQIWVDRGQ
ncbi:MAG: hypothetical protein O7H41_06880 [Planctomycetota bacterium]|nr:hypothetical protein [Planctomycetota bacterium]